MRLTLVILCLVLAGCREHTETKPTQIVIDDWWNSDMTRAYCQSFGSCTGDGVADVRSFERDIVSDFATDEKCSGLSVITFGGPSASQKVEFAEHHWTLMVDFMPDQKNQEWTVVGGTTVYLQGRGTDKEIVNRICIAAKQRGAAVNW